MFPKQILIVEDDQDIRESLAQLLTEEGYGVLLACNGQEALDVLQSTENNLPGLILLDLMMPIKDGYEFRMEQKRHQKFGHIPAVVMTAASYLKGTEKLLDIPRVIRKPIDLDDLLQTVQGFCN
jgi:CheY-like chemotaxis protein